MAKSNILVTGATGFIGSALVERVIGTQGSVWGATRRNAPVSPLFMPVRIGPIDRSTDWKYALSNIDVVVHLAGRAHVTETPEASALSTFREVNVDGTLRLAREAARSGVRRFVFVSSIGVNGNENSCPFTEHDRPDPQEPYAVSKWEAEKGLWEIAAATGIEVVVVRPALVYGPSAPGNFGRLVRCARKGFPLPLGAVTHNRRSLVALDNLVDFLVRCTWHPSAAGETFLVSDGEDVSTAELLRRMGEALECPVSLFPVPVRILRDVAFLVGKRNVARRLLGSLEVDSSKARKVLGWTPPLSMNDGLRRVGRSQ